MTVIDQFIAEFTREAATTRKLLDRLPDDKMDWKPHERSSSLGKLAMHIAGMPGFLGHAATLDEFTLGGSSPVKEGFTRQDVLTVFDASVEKCVQSLKQIPDEKLGDRWIGKFGDKIVIDMPRGAVIRAMLLNHWYHHCGQLSVYLRLLDVPLPSIYGPTADENPFA